MTGEVQRVPDVPVSCAGRPTVGGLVAPFVNLVLADGGVDFRSPHQGRYEQCWRDGLCQTCGGRLGTIAVFFGGPNQLAARTFDEPPVCPPCAVYVSMACPMVAGRQARYADRARISEGHRGHVCPDSGCGCGGFVPSNPGAGDAAGEPAHPWFAVYVPAGGWQVTVDRVRVPCTDRGCLHDRVLINGGRLTVEPRKVILVSEPGRGRLWMRQPGMPERAGCPG